MKKIILLISALFLGCSSLSVDKEEALKGELPKDFQRSVYAEINNDVVKSQVLLEIQDKVKELYPGQEGWAPARKTECGNVLLEDLSQGLSFVGSIYEEYLDCPLKGWNKDKACSGKYAGNSAYTKVNAAGDSTCVIGGCWSGGWNEPFTDIDWANEGYSSLDEYCMVTSSCGVPLKEVLLGTNRPSGIQYGTQPDKINYYMNATQWSRKDVVDTLINVVCKFVMPGMESTAAADNYLKSFSYDSTLIEQHYYLVGRSEGRPYKYCANNETIERNVELHALKLQHSTQGYFYDYSRYLFCLNKDNYKVYETLED